MANLDPKLDKEEIEEAEVEAVKVVPKKSTLPEDIPLHKLNEIAKKQAAALEALAKKDKK